MIVRATSDLHLTQSNAVFIFHALNQMREDAAATGGVTLILGDVLDQAELVHMPTYNRLRDLLQSWPDRMIVIPGNHDQYGERSAIEALEGKRCRVVSVPTAGEFGLLVPYVPPEKYAEARWVAMGSKAPDWPEITWTHQGFKGAYMNAMRRDTTGVDPSWVDNWTITGHYHMPHNVGPIVYCGSPIEHSFAEEGQQKGWIRWELHGGLQPTRVAFEDTGAPRHVTQHVIGDQVHVKPFRRGTDKVRIKSDNTRAQFEAKAEALEARGLGGVPAQLKPDAAMDRRGSHRTGMTVGEAVYAYVDSVHGNDLSRPSPQEMFEWAEQRRIPNL